jgi:hypothetical protein
MKYILFALVACGYLWVSNGSYSDEIAAQNRYCNMVKQQAWPDFSPEINCED